MFTLYYSASFAPRALVFSYLSVQRILSPLNPCPPLSLSLYFAARLKISAAEATVSVFVTLAPLLREQRILFG